MKNFLLNLTTKQKILIVGAVTVILIIIFVLIYKYYYDGSEPIITENTSANQMNAINESTEETTSESKFGKTTKEKTITLHVIGEVISPGVITLKEGARIVDAISACGGKTDNADLTKINLAYVLEDGVQVYIPRIDDNMENIEYIRDDAGENVIIDAVIQEDTKQIKVNINTANSEKLQTLPGIGEAMAERIILYRETNGEFITIEDIKNVSGIGDSKFEKIKEYIVVK